MAYTAIKEMQKKNQRRFGIEAGPEQQTREQILSSYQELSKADKLQYISQIKSN